LIGRNLEELFSRRKAQGSLDEYLKKQNIVAIEGIDTRALVTKVRSQGAMNCLISSEILDAEEVKEWKLILKIFCSRSRIKLVLTLRLGVVAVFCVPSADN
jgi:carbamoylphosphate synthase small subunit